MSRPRECSSSGRCAPCPERRVEYLQQLWAVETGKSDYLGGIFWWGENATAHAAGVEGNRGSSWSTGARARRASLALVVDLSRGIAGEAARRTLVRRRGRVGDLVGVERRRERTDPRIRARLRHAAAGPARLRTF